MMFNPTEDAYIGFPGNIEVNEINPWNWTFGGLHMVYVTNTRYDACSKLRDYFKGDKYSVVRPGLETITWAAPVMISPSDTLNRLKSYKDGLIPNTATVQLRVNNPYQVPDAEYLKAERKGYGTYLFNFKGKSPEDYTALEKENPWIKLMLYQILIMHIHHTKHHNLVNRSRSQICPESAQLPFILLTVSLLSNLKGMSVV